MHLIIEEINSDETTGLARFLQANPHTRFPFYTYDDLITPELFENTFYCESEESKKQKESLSKTLDKPHGKNTFFIVGYQGCGKTTFIHSIIYHYAKQQKIQSISIDCDRRAGANSTDKLKIIFSMQLQQELSEYKKFDCFIDFFNENFNVINQFSNKDNLIEFCNFLDNINKEAEFNEKIFSVKCGDFIRKNLSCEDIFYLLILWKLSQGYNCVDKLKEKLVIIVDNLDYVDVYNDLLTFIKTLDAFTINFSDKFSKFKLCRDSDEKVQYTEKIKLFVAMRETTKASLPESHFSDAFQTIYKSFDMTEWYDKSSIIKNRINILRKYDQQNLLKPEISVRLNTLLKITEDSYTQNVIYPLFNNNYRSMISLMSKIATENYNSLKIYDSIMDIPDWTFRHGARGVLFKLIFDEFNKSDGNDESCFKRIGVLDLLNRKNNEVSICRLLLSYLSNYTETKCDSARNSVSLSALLSEFNCIFEDKKILSSLCAMFELRDTHWTHLVSFNQIGYRDQKENANDLGKIDFMNLDPDQTMIHYSCAGKIYVEYVTTHFEFFTARVFKDQTKALFCEENLVKKNENTEYPFIKIIDRVYSEVEQCCRSLHKFNEDLCRVNRYDNPYSNSVQYRMSHYICQFKRKNFSEENDLEERRFKQFHEDRLINSHIVYIDKFRLYILNYSSNIDDKEKIDINQKLVARIKKYYNLLNEKNVLLVENTKNTLIPHYDKQIKKIEEDYTDFITQISHNK